MHEKIKHPILLTAAVVLVATITIVFWYARIERSFEESVQEEVPATAEISVPTPSEVPPANLLPATPAVLPE